MTKHRDDRARLLAETFHDDWAGGPAAEFARRAARHARRRRRLRRGLAASGSVAVALMLGALVHSRRELPAKSAFLVAPTPAYEIISDEELLAELHDRPLLVLPRENGSRDFVLLEQ